MVDSSAPSAPSGLVGSGVTGSSVDVVVGCVVGQRWGDGVSDVPEWDGGCDDVVVVVGVQWVGVWDDVYVGCGGVRRGGESVAAEFDLGVDLALSGHGRAERAERADPQRGDHDLDHARLDGLARTTSA